MKPLLLFFFLLTQSVQGQDLLLDVLPMIDTKVKYKKVLEVIGDSKTDLSSKALEWFDHKSVLVQINEPLDATHHYVSGKDTFRTLWGPNDFPELYKEVEFKIMLTLKNERYQYEITSFVVKEPNQATQLEIYKMDHKKLSKYNKDFYKRIDEKINALTKSLEEAMSD